MSTHPTHEEDFDLYALGALEGDEKQAIEEHLSACADCARKLAEARGRVALLAFAAPAAVPSPGVKERLLREIQSGAARAEESYASKPAAPERVRGFFADWRSALLASVAVAAALAAIFLATENAQMREQMNSLRASFDQQKHDLAEAREEAEMFGSVETRIVALSPMPGHPMKARVLFNAKMGMVMADVEAPAAPPKMAYQLWVMPKNGKPISAGVFNTAEAGWSMWMADVPKGTEPMMFAITLEPAGGMPHPTGPMVMTTKIS